MTGAAALTRVEMSIGGRAQQINLQIGLKALGTLGKRLFKLLYDHEEAPLTVY